MSASNDEETAPLTDDKLDISKKATHCEGVDYKKYGSISVLVLFLVFFFSGGSTKPEQEIHQVVVVHNTSNHVVPSNKPIKSVSADKRLASFQAAKKALEERLRVDYGSYYEAIFYEEGSFRHVFTSGDKASTLSHNRLKRKLKMKLLQQAGPPQFIWATGGHSATAGHGNFYDESYTAYLEKAAQPVFESIGMTFVGRNYAMGGTAAGPEVALCIREIFGQDIDALVWDFGMTDGNQIWKELLYHHRAGMVKSRPINYVYHAGGRSEKSRIQVAKDMEELGLATFISSEEVMNAALDSVPDSLGMSEEEIQQMPAYVKSFRCDKQIEKGDPYCGAEKYNSTDCLDRKYRVSWHPGYKWQALMGYLAALQLLDTLEESIKEVAQITDTVGMLKELQAQENMDYEKYLKAPMPDGFLNVLSPDTDVDPAVIFKGPMYCHTARLPAEIRHKGILTESPQTGFTTFFMGTELQDALSKPLSSDLMPLVYNKGDRQPCPIPTNMDYKDYFFVSSKDSWRKLVLPNDSEIKEYGTGAPLKGIVAVCFALCPWNKCPSGVLLDTSFHDYYFELKVNNVAVSNFTNFLECKILRHANGFEFPVNNGRMEIQARVTESAPLKSYLRMSSFLIW